ncbi:MAG: ComEC/Rec2 family competence protein, partial [Planctomycetia bacterium]|nr:ComEC/Rec2 family competence protein [Planctomycetia bacterium]
IAVKGGRRMPAPEPDPMQIIPRGDRTRLEIDVVGIRDGAGWQPASGRATLLVDGHLLGIHAGDRVRIFGQLASPSAARNPGEFDFAQHARADRQRSVLRSEYTDCVSVVDRASGLTPWQLLDALRTGGEGLLWRHLDVRHAGLATALLLGDREELGAKQTAGFQETGTAHLLAISGLNIGIVVLTLAWLLRMARVPPVRAAVILAVVAVGYTILTDAQPPVVRAMILVLVWTASQLLRRRALPFNALAAAGLVVLALNPAELFRVGTQLSFLAVAGLMWLAPAWFGRQTDPVDKLVEETRPWLSRSIRRSVRSARHMTFLSAAIWALALPLVMARFHLFSLVAIPLNTLLWLPVGAALVSGYALLALGWLCPPVGVVAAWVCNISLWAIDTGIDLARVVPLGHVWVPGPPEWWLVGFYGALGLFAAVPRLRPPRRWAVALLAAWSGVGFAAAKMSEKPPLECTFLSVGHGSAVVLALPSGKTMLCDAGCFGSPYRGAKSIAECLWQRGVTHVDAVVLSHADADHYNALPELLGRFSVGVVYVSPMMFFDENYPLKHLREAIATAGVPMRELRAGDVLDGGEDCRIEVLHPSGRGIVGNDNANSLVLSVEYRGRRILLPGDLEPPGLDDVMAELPLDCDVVMVPHHGSRRSNPPGLAAWCTPEAAVISGGLDPDPTATEAAYRDSGVKVFNTARLGAVRVTIEPGGVSMCSFRESEW